MLVAVAGLAIAAASPALHAAQNSSGQGSGSSNTSASSSNQGKTADNRAGTQVRVTRATDFLGADVLSQDDRKVGDTVDYIFDVGSAPHLRYVVVMTGGFLDMGGDRRAVPATAITTEGDTCRIDVASGEYWNVPILPSDSKRFLDDQQNRDRIAGFFQNKESSQSGSQNQKQGNPGASQAGSGSDAQLISFSELRNADAFGAQDGRLGFFADAWINLNENRAPFVEITTTYRPFRTNFDRRYAVPTARIEGERDTYGYAIQVSRDDLDNADTVSETDGVRMLQDGTVGDAVLRVTLPKA